MGCTSSASLKSNTSHSSLKDTEEAHSSNNVGRGSTKVGPEATSNGASEGARDADQEENPRALTRNSGIAFEVMIGDEKMSARRPRPKRLSSRLEPIDGPRLTAEELEEKLRLAERKRNSELESRAKTASESRRQSKRKRELMIARELERQHQQAKELEEKLKSAEKQRELRQKQKSERQKLQDERIKRARLKKEKLLLDDDVISDVERDDNFNADDVDSWLEGSNNETNTVDTGFSSATSERIYSGRESPRKRYNLKLTTRSSQLTSASTVDSYDVFSYKQSKDNLRHAANLEEEDKFFDD